MLSGSRLAIDRALEDFLGGATARLNAIDPHLIPLSDALGEFLAGGKRLRPLFALAGYVGAGGAQREEELTSIYKAVISLELLQTCALIHDDMMDGSDTRRGAPSIHRRFAREHQLRAGKGGSDDFGNAAALLLGDLALVLSTEALNRSGISDRQREAFSNIFDTMQVELMAGQYLDMYASSRDEVSVDDALKIAIYKSGKYTIERPLHFGAALAGASAELMQAYSNYGLPLGEAFQLRDDLLGVFGNPSETGKPAGDDLREGKRTALLAIAQERANTSQSGQLKKHIGDPNLTPSMISDLQQIITDTGATSHIETMIEELTSTSLTALNHDGISPDGKKLLTELAILATNRKI